MIEFWVKSYYKDTKKKVRVKVYDTVEELRDAARAYGAENVDECLGICHPFTSWKIRPGEEDKKRPFCAIVRIAKPHHGIGVLSHELAHAAVHVHAVETDDRPLVPGDDEDFAWILGDFIRQATIKMYDKGLWT